MKEIDFHGFLVNNAIKEFNNEIKRHEMLVLITGYGSSSNSSKIRNALIRELKKSSYTYFVGSELNVENEKYKALDINIKNKLNKYLLSPSLIGIIIVVK